MMKKIQITSIIFIFLLTLGGCYSNTAGLKEISSLDFESGKYDVDTRYLKSRGQICKYEDVYYINMLEYIWYYDDVSKTYGKLCGRPECMHDTQSCDAYTGSGRVGGGIQVYDGKLYFDYDSRMGPKSIWRMDPDGNNRESVGALQHLMGSYANLQWRIHRGNIYHMGNWHTVDKGQDRRDLFVDRYRISQNGERERIIELMDYHPFGNWLLQGDYLFLDGSLGDWGKREFYIYDLKNDVFTLLIDESFSGYIADFLVDEEGVTFFARDWDEVYIMRYDFNTKKNTVTFRHKEKDVDFGNYLSYDGKYVLLYRDNEYINNEEVVVCEVYSVENDREAQGRYYIKGEKDKLDTGIVEVWGSDETGIIMQRQPKGSSDCELWRIPYENGEAECLIIIEDNREKGM